MSQDAHDVMNAIDAMATETTKDIMVETEMGKPNHYSSQYTKQQMVEWLISDSESMIEEAIREYEYENDGAKPSDEELFDFIMDYDGTIPDLCYWQGRLHQWRDIEDLIKSGLNII